METEKKSVSGCLPCRLQLVSADSMMHELAESLGAAIDAKDPFTSLHSEEVAEIAHAIALSMGIKAAHADIIHVAGHLHDIGKIGVPDFVLKKQGPLTWDEWDHIRKHPDIGADILKPVGCLNETGIVEMVRHHHERWDGKGYPARIKGEDIPIGARIICLADAVSAMLQNRPYRAAQTFEDASEEILNCSGAQFDPGVVEAFMKIQGKIKSVIDFLGPADHHVA